MTDKKSDFPSEEEWEAEQARLRHEQGLLPGQTPEVRPQAFAHSGVPDGEVVTKLKESGSNLAPDAPAHGYKEHKAAHDNAQNPRSKSVTGEVGPEMFYPGTHAYINNPEGKGSEHHGRAVAVNRVVEYKTPKDEALANSGYNHDRRYAQVKTYECSTRDGRAEMLVVNSEHLQRVPVTEFHRTVT